MSLQNRIKKLESQQAGDWSAVSDAELDRAIHLCLRLRAGKSLSADEQVELSKIEAKCPQTTDRFDSKNESELDSEIDRLLAETDAIH
jgi:uncharacterized coiled-coil protein SlyX